MSLLDKFAPLAELRGALAASGSVPSVATPMDEIHSATEGTIDGRRVLFAGTNNYLGLTFDPECQRAAIEAVEKLGTGTTGSRMASGNYAGHRALEREFAAAFNWPAAIVFSTGYQANLGAISALAGQDEYLLIDADSHASIHDACRLSLATTIRFRHNDPENLARRLERLGENARRTLVVVESLYSVLGDRAPLKEFVEVTQRHGAMIIVDEAHSFGMYGPKGLGICAEMGLLDRVDFVVGTFSKSLGGVGGFCVSRHREFDLLRLGSRPYIFTASPPPPVIAAARAALQRLLKGDDLRTQLWRNIERFNSAVTRLGYRTGTQDPGPVTALVFSERSEAIAHWQGLLDAGIYTNLMVPPATPAGLYIVRISLSAAHTDAQITRMIEAFEGLSSRLRPAA
ncbi:MAG TPA: aminotransferase class I/II-fold pyridoxal phosphate-dependent enzyme [Steroidobacteraceae bacterium]|nr:aminotransferase class I/II-fold pyridoxal phosphate-dependent enzyme [Steroidobacteraceae bacterium]